MVFLLRIPTNSRVYCVILLYFTCRRLLRVIYKSAHFVNVNFFLLRVTHVIVTKNGLKYIFLIKKPTVVLKESLGQDGPLFFAFNIALFCCIFVLIQFVLEFRLVSLARLSMADVTVHK